MRSELPTRATLALAILCVAIGVGALYGSPVFRAATARELG